MYKDKFSFKKFPCYLVVTFICSMSTTETVKKGVNYGQS